MSYTHDAPGTAATTWREAIDRHAVPALELGDATRVVVLAAHPDDETLGAGGLLASAHRAGLEVVVVVATRGEGSHPHSPTVDRERLAVLRSAELHAAAQVLAPGSDPHLIGWPDGGVADHEDDLASYVVDLVGDGRRTLLVATWRHDGHPDHEAVGRAAATVAARTGARLLEYAVWFWHWGQPAQAPWPDARRLELTPDDVRRKAAAVAEHRTQVQALSDHPGDEVLLAPGFLEHFAAPRELFFEQAAHDAALDELHREQSDPWGVDHRFYEQRKRALVTAMLPRARFRRGLELGCSTGALAETLADRCDELVALDASAAAVDAATARLAEQRHVQVVRGELPEAVPEGPVDLVVLSEVGYFLSPVALERLASALADRLTDDGVVVLCHWRHAVVGWPLDGPAVHRALVASGRLPGVVAEYRDRDVEVLVLAAPEQLPDPHATPED